MGESPKRNEGKCVAVQISRKKSRNRSTQNTTGNGMNPSQLKAGLRNLVKERKAGGVLRRTYRTEREIERPIPGRRWLCSRLPVFCIAPPGLLVRSRIATV